MQLDIELIQSNVNHEGMIKKLKPRERILLAINHKEPDRVPVDVGGAPATTLLIPAYDNLKKILKLKKETRILDKFFQMAVVDDEVARTLDVDAVLITPYAPYNYKDTEFEDGSYIDEWGIKAVKKPKDSIYYSFGTHPLGGAVSIGDISRYKFPDAVNSGRFRKLKERIDYLYNNTDFAIIGSSGVSVFERSWYLRGLENIFNDMFFNKKLLHILFNRISDYCLAKAEKFLDIVGDYIQVYFTGDDLGTQHGPLMSTALYREFVKPYHKKIYGFIKSKTKAKIIIHSCGSIYDFLPDLIDAGIDGINPVQTTAFKMEPGRLKRDFGSELIFWGGIDTQKILPFGTEEDLKNEIINKIEALASGGGYVLAAVHAIQPDVKPQRVLKMIKLAKEYGRYRNTKN